MSEYILAFDVGGTYIKSVILDDSGSICSGTKEMFHANANASRDEVLSHFVRILSRQTAKLEPKSRISGIGYAFPGPFDYENGICWIQGVDKYDAIYGVNLREEIMARLDEIPELRPRLSPDFDIAFENDARLFALGEWYSGKAAPFERCICLTIGTGMGSAFIERGKLLISGRGVPENGWLFSQPFGDSNVDERISRRGILRMASAFGLSPEWDVKELAEQAFNGNVSAKELFLRFGGEIGSMIVPYAKAFQADGIVIGGQIAKSAPLFDLTLKGALSAIKLSVVYAEDTSASTYAGVYHLLSQRRKRKGRETQ